MGFRNPITSAAAVDTGQPAGAGARLYQGSDATGVFGVLEFRDGIVGDSPVKIIGRANLTPQGGGTYTEQGGSLVLGGGSYSGVTLPSFALDVDSLPVGSYGGQAWLSGAGRLDIGGAKLTGVGGWDDTGWTKLTPPAGWADNGTGSFWRVVGGWASVLISAARTGATTTTNTTLWNLPAQGRPTKDVFNVGIFAGTTVETDVLHTGDVVVGPVANGKGTVCHFAYPLN